MSTIKNRVEFSRVCVILHVEGNSNFGLMLGQNTRICKSVIFETRKLPYRSQSPENVKYTRSDAKVTFGIPVEVTQKVRMIERVVFESLIPGWPRFGSVTVCVRNG